MRSDRAFSISGILKVLPYVFLKRPLTLLKIRHFLEKVICFFKVQYFLLVFYYYESVSFEVIQTSVSALQTHSKGNWPRKTPKIARENLGT